MRRATGVLGALVVGAVAVLVIAGLGSPRAYPPTGIDGLRIPLPSLRPSDFVTRIDNPWLPLSLRGRWVYDVQPHGRRIVAVTGRGSVAGVPTTEVTTRGQRAGGNDTGPVVAVDDYAQDRAGNVWWLAHRGPDATWRAGTEGAQAGLAMPRHPRLGDGWRTAYQPRRVDDIAEVVALGGDDVTIEVTSPLEPGTVTRLTYRRGGLVSRIVSDTGEIDTLD